MGATVTAALCDRQPTSVRRPAFVHRRPYNAWRTDRRGRRFPLAAGVIGPCWGAPWQEAQSAMGEIPAAVRRTAISQLRKATAGAFGLAPILMALITTVTGVAHDQITAPSNLRAPAR